MKLWFALLAWCVVLTSPLVAETLQCRDPIFRVTGDDPIVLERTCHVAALGRSKLAACNVLLNRPIEIRVLERIKPASGECLGIYHCGEDTIDVLSPSAMSSAREPESAFAAISDDVYWESVIVHELTHAAYDVVPCPFSDCVATSEYVSYAMQVWTLPEAERPHFGKGIELRTKPTWDAISPLILFMAPNRFAVLSWLHFQARPDPCSYMQSIMDGNMYFDREPL